MFDMYNMQVYPGLHPGDPDGFPFLIPMRNELEADEYLRTLTTELPKFFDLHSDAKLVFYNAGTDIVAGDKLGRLNVNYQGVRQRDFYVLKQLVDRALPTVVMTSGGYSDQSWRLIAEMGVELLQESVQ